MRGHNVNIYFNEVVYKEISHLIEERKISAFVNKAVESELLRSKEERRNKIMLACQRMASDKEFQSEQIDWDKTVGDGIDSE